MGFTPAEVGAMSLWQFMACAEGWRKAHSSEKPGMRPEEIDDVAAMFDAMPSHTS